MNGASADDCANTMITPNSSNMPISGISHHFFLVFRKPQINFVELPAATGDLSSVRFGIAFNLVRIDLRRNPVGILTAGESLGQQILAEQPHKQADRRQNYVIE